MRILIVAGGELRREYGGGQVYVRWLVDALTAAGHNVAVATNAADIIAAIARDKTDIVHAHGHKLAAARAAVAANVPCVVTMHHGGLVCPSGALLDKDDQICRRAAEQCVCTGCCLRGRWWGRVPLGVGRLLRRLPNIPFVTPAMCTSLTVREKLDEIAALARDVRMFVAPSAAARDALERNAIPRDRIAVLPHGIVPLAPQPLPPAPPVRFAYVGRLSREKGVHVLVEAFRRVRGDTELHIIGDAHNKWERRYLRGLGVLPRVVFRGHLGGDALAAAWAACGVTVLPSICLEVFGLVVAESFSLGRPVIATDCGGPPEQIRNNVDGLVVPPNDADALAAAMQRFVDKPGLVGEFAARLPRARTMREHVAELEQVYARLGR